MTEIGHEIEERKTLKVEELKIEVETEIHDKGKMLSEIEIPKGWRLLTIQEVIFLFNNYLRKLNMNNTCEFIEQQLNFNRKKNYIARFVADSGGAYLFCDGGASCAGASLGVRFCRDLQEEK